MYRLTLLLSLSIWSGDIDKLSDDDFWVREAATSRLINAMPLDYLAVQLGTQSKDPEVRKRCKWILERGSK